MWQVGVPSVSCFPSPYFMVGEGGRKWGSFAFINSHWGERPRPVGLSLPVSAYEQKGWQHSHPCRDAVSFLQALDITLGGCLQGQLQASSPASVCSVQTEAGLEAGGWRAVWAGKVSCSCSGQEAKGLLERKLLTARMPCPWVSQPEGFTKGHRFLTGK